MDEKIEKVREFLDVIGHIFIAACLFWMIYSDESPENWIGHGSFFGDNFQCKVYFLIAAITYLYYPRERR